MMRSWMRRLLGMTSALILTAVGFPLCLSAADPEGEETDDLLAVSDAPDYLEYLAAHSGTARPSGRIVLTAADISGEQDSHRLTGYLGYEWEAVCTEEGGYVEYTFVAEQAGFYTISADFCVPDGRHTAAERDILVNGTLPYSEAAGVTFKRRWVNSSPIGQDTNGNDIRPVQQEEEGWQTRFLTDAMGYHASPLTFYFEQGSNTLRFSAVREP